MVVVFGSINIDIAVRIDALPQRGETVLGGDCLISPGGKGANQAHAARLAGAEVAMAGKVGRDAFAEAALVHLRSAGVELSHVESDEKPTGCATIWVEDGGASTIVVASGANTRAVHSQVPDAVLETKPLLLLQHEVPLRETWRLVDRATRFGARVILNAAPAFAVPEAVLDGLEILIVNEIECGQIAARVGGGDVSAERLPEWLARRFGLTVIATYGERGSLCHSGSGAFHVPAAPIRPVDTTGAGDTFSGVLAAALDAGRGLEAAVRMATAAAAVTCTRAGAQTSQPSRDEIAAMLPAVPAA